MRRRSPQWLSPLPLQDPTWQRLLPHGHRRDLSPREGVRGEGFGVACPQPGPAVLAASLGAHPAFRWPLRDGTQTDYRIEFAAEEPGPRDEFERSLRVLVADGRLTAALARELLAAHRAVEQAESEEKHG